MSAAYWLQFRQGNTLETQGNDCLLLCEYTEQLDVLCQQLEVPELSGFIDSTDAAYNVGVFDEVAEEFDLESEDPPYPIEKMQWFTTASGLQMFRALRVALIEETVTLPELSIEENIDLLEEIADCIGQLEDSQLQFFHLALVM